MLTFCVVFAPKFHQICVQSNSDQPGQLIAFILVYVYTSTNPNKSNPLIIWLGTLTFFLFVVVLIMHRFIRPITCYSVITTGTPCARHSSCA